MLPKFILVTMLCIMLSAKSSNSLKCYECSNCMHESADTEECEQSETACLKYTLGDKIFKKCQNSNFCTLQTVEKGLSDTWNKLWHTFTGEKAGKNTDTVSCCFTDYCNSGNSVRNALGVIGALFLALSMAYI